MYKMDNLENIIWKLKKQAMYEEEAENDNLEKQDNNDDEYWSNKFYEDYM